MKCMGDSPFWNVAKKGRAVWPKTLLVISLILLISACTGFVKLGEKWGQADKEESASQMGSGGNTKTHGMLALQHGPLRP